MNDTGQSWLSWFARGIILFGLLVITARLIELQAIKADYYKSLADSNRIRRVAITSPRGEIMSREGDILVGNKSIAKKIIFDSKQGYVKTTDLAVNGQEIKETTRDYLLADEFSHVAGYLGEVREDEVGRINPDCPQKGPFKLGQLVGRSGLEKEYECILSGVDGEVLIEVDTTGKEVRVLGIKEPIPGSDLKTNINKGLQEFVSKTHKSKGAVVVTDAFGQVLALQSFPMFDPDSFINKAKSDYLSNILVADSLPLFNRVVSGSYHPGSVFKPIVAIAALTEEVIDKDYSFNDTGIIVVNGFTYSNWFFTQYGGKEGEIGLARALSRSTDTFFYKAGELLGIDNLVKWASYFGFAKKTGIDLPGEVAGLVPSPKWKENTKGENWFLGNTYHFSIGQGDLQTTPVQINSAIAALANGGELCSPQVAKKGKKNCRNIFFNKDDRQLVIDGMVGACKSGGTAYPFFDFKVKREGDENKDGEGSWENTASGLAEGEDSGFVVCKTGTAETVKENVTHAWFVAFAPTDSPEIVVTVLVEEGGEGSSVAAPITREIFDYWFNNETIVNFERYPKPNEL